MPRGQEKISGLDRRPPRLPVGRQERGLESFYVKKPARLYRILTLPVPSKAGDCRSSKLFFAQDNQLTMKNNQL
jgi:hypothetical protein